MKVNIFMDDLRPCYKGWLLARTTSECLELLEKHKGNVHILSLDHDMTENDNDGYWLVKEIVNRGLYADKVFFHTANPVGRENMYHYLKNAIKYGVVPEMKVYGGPVPFETDLTEGDYVPWE
jgi:hypothetical protein